jgi:16S rRNA (guanine(966)-N(2))-methyltransferase RsmD
VKQALFNILGDRIDGAAFLDLFAGAGGIGIEALSRGARSAVFVDASRESLNMVKHNIDQMGFSGRAKAVLADAWSFMKKPAGFFDIVFLDPPYAEEMQPLLDMIAKAGILKPDSVVVAEHFKKQPSPENAGLLSLYREARYGDTVLAFYKTR